MEKTLNDFFELLQKCGSSFFAIIIDLRVTLMYMLYSCQHKALPIYIVSVFSLEEI